MMESQKSIDLTDDSDNSKENLELKDEFNGINMDDNHDNI